MKKLLSLILATIVFSASSNSGQAGNVADGSAATTWNSGGFAPQWIEIDLGELRVINKVRLLPQQYPTGQTAHVITAGTTAAPTKIVCTASGSTSDNVWVDCNFSPTLARYIRVTTTASPSWVAWREIQVIDAPVISNPINRIGKRQVGSAGEFYDTVTGLSFVPSGYNYVRLNSGGFHSLFLASGFDSVKIDRDLDFMNRLGVNTVRVFIIPSIAPTGIAGSTPNTLDPTYLSKVNQFTDMAANHGVHIIYVISAVPVNYFPSPATTCLGTGVSNNSYYLCQDVIDLKKQYALDFIAATQNNAIIGYDIQNEPQFLNNAIPLASGFFIAFDGLTYSLPADKERVMALGLINWANTISDAVHAVYPDVLVGASFYASNASAPPIVTRSYWPIAYSNLDFIGVHIYPNPARAVSIDLDAFEIPPIHNKALVLDEIGAQKSLYTISNVQAAMNSAKAVAATYGVRGSLLWTWDTSEQTPGFWLGIDGIQP